MKKMERINVLREKKEFESFLKKSLTNERKYDIILKLLLSESLRVTHIEKKKSKTFSKKALDNFKKM